MRIHVASYAAAPAAEPWDPAAEAALLEGLSRLGVAGLELPFTGRLHKHDDAWLLEHIRPEWTLVVSALPGVMNTLATDPVFGLASADEDGRRRAVEFHERLRRTVEHLAAWRGGSPVVAVELHSAPRIAGAAKGSADALARSLTELRGRDWKGATLLLEHCDAAVPGRPADKGFLTIGDELAALAASKGVTRAALSINWGRSAIETRSAEGPAAHLRAAKTAGALGALFFSGATAKDAEYGEWADRHAPFSTRCPASLLTPEAAAAALDAAGELPLYGLKIQPLPKTLGVGERLAIVADGLDRMRAASAA